MPTHSKRSWALISTSSIRMPSRAKRGFPDGRSFGCSRPKAIPRLITWPKWSRRSEEPHSPQNPLQHVHLENDVLLVPHVAGDRRSEGLAHVLAREGLLG